MGFRIFIAHGKRTCMNRLLLLHSEFHRYSRCYIVILLAVRDSCKVINFSSRHEQVDIRMSKNQVLQMLYLKHHVYNFINYHG